MKLLVIEDEQKVAALLVKGLQSAGHLVDVAATTRDAWRVLCDGYYDIIILDIKLPDGDGISLSQRIREAQIATPILMLTARDSIDDKVTGLSAGADDYLTKPFAFKELIARLNALQRRPSDYEDTTLLQVRDIELYPNSFTVKSAGEVITLSRKEFAVLELLMRNSNQVVTKELILERVWSTDADPVANVVEVVIARLRQKLGPDSSGKSVITTVRGLGYTINS